MPDYNALLDAEMRAYIARCDALYPTDAVTLDITGQRRVYDAMCADFDVGRPAGVVVQDRSFGGVACRQYDVGAARTCVVYFHGGGFVVGGLDSHDSICAEICAGTGFRVVAVDYPLAPEHQYPEDFNAAWDAYCAVSAEVDGPVIVAGDSAGGNLAAGVSHRGRDVGKPPAGQVLIYPGLGGSLDLPSYSEHAHAPQLTRADIEFYMDIRTGGPGPTGDPYYAPLHDDTFAGLPPTCAISAECDPIASDAEIYVEQIQRAGGAAQWINAKGMVHGYLRARIMSRAAKTSFDEICDVIRAMGAA